jgi:endonuclease/exonuclease/phosphatase (EEP) superfamily protein YafD
MKYIPLLRVWLIASFIAVSAASIACSVAGFIPGFWLCDLASQFRILYEAVFFLSAFVMSIASCRIGLALCVLCFLINGFPIVETFLPRECSSKSSRQNISILLFNTEFQHNVNYGLFENIIQQCQPDVVAIVEVDQAWLDQLSGVMSSYAYRRTTTAGAGMALYSKLPIERIELRYMVRSIRTIHSKGAD